MSWTVVAGATGAIGSVVVTRLRSEGHRVLAVARGRDALDALVAEDPAIAACVADLGVDECVRAIDAALGDDPVRMLVHLAAAPLGGDILEVPADVVLAAIDVKVNGLLRLVRAAGDRLLEGSTVVAVGGNLGFDPVPTMSTAGIGNAAQANVVRQLSHALGHRGVGCHTVAPGPVSTDRWLDATAAEAERTGADVDALRSRASADSPLGRLVSAEEVAWAIARLGDPEAAALTGSTLLLDGGRRRALP